MEVIYHPLAQGDVLEILRYYHDVSPLLADEFLTELRTIVGKAANNPLRFPAVGQGFRRANLKRFPYHFLYEENLKAIRLMVVRHNKRHPDFGLRRR